MFCTFLGNVGSKILKCHFIANLAASWWGWIWSHHWQEAALKDTYLAGSGKDVFVVKAITVNWSSSLCPWDWAQIALLDVSGPWLLLSNLYSFSASMASCYQFFLVFLPSAARMASFCLEFCAICSSLQYLIIAVLDNTALEFHVPLPSPYPLCQGWGAHRNWYTTSTSLQDRPLLKESVSNLCISKIQFQKRINMCLPHCL